MTKWFDVFFVAKYFDASIYSQIIEYCENWNVQNKFKFEISDYDCSVDLPYSELPKVISIIEEMKLRKWKVLVLLKYVYKSEDYLKADYIRMEGAGLNDKFYKEELNPSNEKYVCERCNGNYGLLLGYRKFEKLFVMDESYTRKPQNGQKQKPKVQWDIFDIASGGLFISKRMVDFFEKHHVTGYKLTDVVDEKSGKISGNYFMLGSDTIITSDCNEHTLRQGDFGSCPACGSEMPSDLFSELHFKETDINGKDIFIHGLLSTNGRTYFSQRLYKLLLESDLEGISPSNIATVCNH